MRSELPGASFWTDAMKGLTNAWSMPGGAGTAVPGGERMQAFMLEWDAFLNEATARQAQVLATASDRFSAAAQDMLAARQPADFMAIQARLMNGLTEDVLAEAKAWAALGEKLRDCCATLAPLTPQAGGERAARTEPAEAAEPKPAVRRKPAVKVVKC